MNWAAVAAASVIYLAAYMVGRSDGARKFNQASFDLGVKMETARRFYEEASRRTGIPAEQLMEADAERARKAMGE